jgi:hypothetical protein
LTPEGEKILSNFLREAVLASQKGAGR